MVAGITEGVQGFRIGKVFVEESVSELQALRER